MIGLAMIALLVGAATATAEQLTLQLEGGRVSLVARDVSVEQVLAEWARLGSTTIVVGELVRVKEPSPGEARGPALPRRSARSRDARPRSGECHRPG